MGSTNDFDLINLMDEILPQESIQKKKKIIQKKTEPPKKKNIDFEDFGDDDELKQLARTASMEEQIAKSELAKYKVEKVKMDLEKEAGTLIHFQDAKFLFIGYMEKMNDQMLGIMKRNQARLENLIKERDYSGVEKLVNREITNTIIEIKKQQKKDLDEWVKERK